MENQRTEYIQADDYERSESRQSQRNGYYERDFTTRVGTLELKVPRTRDGEFSPTVFERYQRNEKALLARTAKNALVGEYIDQPKYTKACEILDNGFEDAFQYTVIGNSHNRLKSTNLLERLNQEVRRREKIIRIFPNRTSANRLIGAVLMDLHDEWLSSTRKYIKFDQ